MDTTLEKREEIFQTPSFEEKDKYYDEKEESLSVNEANKGTRDITDIDFEDEDMDIRIVNQIASVEDDPTIKVLTLRAVVCGCEGTIFNPGPFNAKEHTFMYVIISSANASAYGTYILGAQQLYYNAYPSAAGGIFLLFATQLIGYGIAGQLRPFLVYPSIMIWPNSLPTISFIKTFNAPGSDNKALIKFFFAIFFSIFVYEIFPQYIFPVLSAISIVCLARRDSPWVQHIFGGMSVNEGLGIGSISLDWSYLSSLSPLVLPLYVQFNLYAGILVLWLVIPLAYYYNLWDAQSFPFMANGLFKLNKETGTSSKYPQALILDEYNNINQTALEEVGRPYFSTAMAINYICINIGVTATITHTILYYGANIKKTAIAIFRKKESRENDIHNRLMAAYKEVPTWWYYIIFVCGIGLNIGIGYANHSQLPWWGFLLAILLATILSLPMNMILAITGINFGLNVVAEMICGFILPGNPIANMYFKTLGFNTVNQAGHMANDLKIGHYMKVPPRLILMGQILGTVIGCIFNYIVNYTIINSKREELLDPAGNIWSGTRFQTMNSAGLTWGGLGPMLMFGPSTQYNFILWGFIVGFAVPLPFWLLHKFFPKVGFNYINTPTILFGLVMFPGNNSSWITVSFIVVLISQLYVKRRYNKWYVKHNYLMSAALDSGTSLMSFILAMTVFGGGDGVERPFPTWGGNPNLGYLDYCCADCE
ncbi:OPT family small oligopeptide transporter [Phycomyces nitens]|nr:OPT family small oligopeptide transporter [Phycomyces nitens]